MRRRRLSPAFQMQRIAGVPAARALVPSAASPVVAPGYVDSLVSATPTPGRFYQIKQGDNLSEISRRSLDSYQQGLGSKGTTRLQYIHCMTVGAQWNGKLYGSTYFSNNFPAFYGVDGWGLARAGYAWHEPAHNLLRAGKWPRRLLTEQGSRIPGGSTLPLLWLPTIGGFEKAEGQAFNGTWLPICTGFDPPAELLDALRSQPKGWT